MNGSLLFIYPVHGRDVFEDEVTVIKACSEFGLLKLVKVKVDAETGRRKGFAVVEFYDNAAAEACRQGLRARSALNARWLHEKMTDGDESND